MNKSKKTYLKGKNGITLIALIVTIIILIILAGISINLVLGDNGLIDKSKKTNFLTEYAQVQELIDFYMVEIKADNIILNKVDYSKLPLSRSVTEEEREVWKNEKIELINQIEEKTNTQLENTNLYWIDLNKIGSNIKHKYIMDLNTKLIFDYEGHIYSNKIHHIPDSIGVADDNFEIGSIQKPEIEEIPQYPIMKMNGIKKLGEVNIRYQQGDNIENYYSIDNCQTWNEYTGTFYIDSSTTIFAKSIDTKTGMENITSTEAIIQERALNRDAYDGDLTTADNSGKMGEGYKYMLIDSSVIGSRIEATLQYRYAQLRLLDENENVLYKSEISGVTSGTITVNFEILEGSKWLVLYCSSEHGDAAYLKEIKVMNEPIINVIEESYPILTKQIITSSPMVLNFTNIDAQNIEKTMYSKDNITWSQYGQEEIYLQKGERIYVKNILKVGGESQIVSIEHKSSPRAINENSYDGLLDTYDNSGKSSEGYKYMLIDSSAIGSTIEATLQYRYAQLRLLNENNEVIYSSEIPGTSGAIKTVSFEIIEGSKWLVLYCNSSNGDGALLQEIGLNNRPIVSVTQKAYPILTNTGVKDAVLKITLSNNDIGVVEKIMYSRDINVWKEYNGEEIEIPLGERIYAKNVFADGEESQIIQVISKLDSRAITQEAYDGNEETLDDAGKSSEGYKYMLIDSSVIGKKIEGIIQGSYTRLRLLDANETVLHTSERPGSSNAIKTVQIEILENSKYLALYCSSSSGNISYLKEVKLLD